MNKKEEKKEIKGMTITGQTRIWKKTFPDQNGESRPTYSISIGRKQKDSDQYDHAYMNVFFADKCRPSADLEDGGYDITIKSAFLTVTKKREGFIPAIMVTDWE